MYRHRLDLLSLLLGAAVIAVGVIASTDRLGSVINGRPDSLIPVAALVAGAIAVFVALRRAATQRATRPLPVDSESDQQAI